MKKLLFVFIAAAVAALNSCSNPGAYDGIAAGTPEFNGYSGVYTLYPPADNRFGDAPKGYEPVHISHYGRHGSRYILQESQYIYVHDVLKKAYEDSKLTALGEELHDRFMEVYPMLSGREGELSQIGREQQKIIAKRMYLSYPQIFKSSPKIEAVTTMTSRTIFSMSSFCEGLIEENPSLDIRQEATILNIGKLNPYKVMPTVDSRVLKGTDAFWWKDYCDFVESFVEKSEFLARIFNDVEYASATFNTTDFMFDLYYVTVHFQGTDQNHVSFAKMFTESEMKKLWECDNAKLYMEKGLGSRLPNGSIYAADILQGLLDETEAYLEDETPSVRLRFGHDGCLMALYSLMEIEGWNIVAKDFSDAKNVFSTNEICMAANFQMVFYRGSSDDDVILRMYLNEEPCRLPLEEIGDRYYRWDDFKTFNASRVSYAKDAIENTRHK